MEDMVVDMGAGSVEHEDVVCEEELERLVSGPSAGVDESRSPVVVIQDYGSLVDAVADLRRRREEAGGSESVGVYRCLDSRRNWACSVMEARSKVQP